jgi:hypothetical protein
MPLGLRAQAALVENAYEIRQLVSYLTRGVVNRKVRKGTAVYAVQGEPFALSVLFAVSNLVASTIRDR